MLLLQTQIAHSKDAYGQLSCIQQMVVWFAMTKLLHLLFLQTQIVH